MDGGVGFDEPELSWSTQDIEQKIGISRGCRRIGALPYPHFMEWK